jgi:hypothetical protein
VSNYAGVDLDGVNAELSHYVAETAPQNQSSSDHRGTYITSQSAPACGRARAIELTERVRPILNALYPTWSKENDGSKYFEFRAERDACQRLLARIKSDAEISGMLGGLDVAPRLSANELHDLVWRAASAQWSTGHFHEAVLAAGKSADSILQAKVGRRDLSDVKLVREAFSEKDRYRVGHACASQRSKTSRLVNPCGRASWGSLRAAFRRSETRWGICRTSRTS